MSSIWRRRRCKWLSLSAPVRALSGASPLPHEVYAVKCGRGGATIRLAPNSGLTVKTLYQRILSIGGNSKLFTQLRRVQCLFRGLVRQQRDGADIAADLFGHRA